MHVRVKICGLTRDDGVAAAAAAGVDAVGFVFADSPRRVGVERARELAAGLPPTVERVAVFRHPQPEDVARVLEHWLPDVVQCEPDAAVVACLGGRVRFLPVLHDDAALAVTLAGLDDRTVLHEDAALAATLAGLDGRTVLHDDAALAATPAGLDGRTVLLEAAGRGGRGVAPDWNRAAELARRLRLILAGGLGPDNVGAAIRRVRPYGVDVSSGVECAPGVKDPERIAAFVRAVRRAEAPAGETP